MLGQPRRRDRLRRRRHADHLQHQHRRRRRIGRAAGVRPGADRLQLPRTRRPDRRRPRLRHRSRWSGARRWCSTTRSAPSAVYSDGKPITCDDMVLAWASQSGRFPGFDAANRAGYSDIASVDCAPGQKKARVSFAQDRGFVDFGQLFAATSMMPSHVIADELGLGRRRHHRAAEQRRPVGRAHRAGVEQHLEPDPRPGPQAVPVVGALQAGIGDQGRRGRAGRQRQVVGRQARHQQDHRVAARRRHPGPRQPGRLRRRRHRDRFVGNAEPARRLRPHRLPVGGHRTAHLRRRRDRWPPRPRVGRLRCARRAT